MIAAHAVPAGFAVNPEAIAVPLKVADCPGHAGEVAPIPTGGKAPRVTGGKPHENKPRHLKRLTPGACFAAEADPGYTVLILGDRILRASEHFANACN